MRAAQSAIVTRSASSRRSNAQVVDEPVWIDRLMLDAIHFDQLQQYGGLPGIKGENAIESALGRPRNKWAYEPDADLALLAAAYGYCLATSHGYGDANKRTAFAVMYTFLGVNGWEIDAPEVEVVSLMQRVADRRCDEPDLASWLTAHLTPFTD
jgi:death on curing protein